MGIMCAPYLLQLKEICQGNTLVVESKDKVFRIGYREIRPRKDPYEDMILEAAEKTDDMCLGTIVCFNGPIGPFFGEYLEDYNVVKPKIYNARETTSDDPNGIRVVVEGTDFEKFVTFEKGSIA